ncbi:MAG: hypothetical protein AB1791_05850 [Chloroflexota bacterium]
MYQTAAFGQDMKKRPGVERIIAHLTRYHPQPQGQRAFICRPGR